MVQVIDNLIFLKALYATDHNKILKFDLQLT
jgi:hypothetical protein